MSTSLPDSDRARLREIAASDGPLAPHECAERARLAGALVAPGQFDQRGTGEAVLLWRDEHSEAWLNLWWQHRLTGAALVELPQADHRARQAGPFRAFVRGQRPIAGGDLLQPCPVRIRQ